MKYMIGFDHANARTKFVILQSGLTKIDFKAYKIAGDCGSLYSARFSTTNNKSRISLSFILLCLHNERFREFSSEVSETPSGTRRGPSGPSGIRNFKEIHGP